MAPELPVFQSSLENCHNFNKTSTALIHSFLFLTDGGLSTEVIIYIAMGCAGGVMVLFCLCFFASRFQKCTSGEKGTKKLILAMSRANNNGKQKKPEKNKETTELSNGVVNKG